MIGRGFHQAMTLPIWLALSACVAPASIAEQQHATEAAATSLHGPAPVHDPSPGTPMAADKTGVDATTGHTGAQANQTRPDGATDRGQLNHTMTRINMQGGPAPVDARDPHLYSNGYQLDAGPYALPGERQLRMADEHHFGAVRAHRLEQQSGSGMDPTAYDLSAWYGTTYDRLIARTEGEMVAGRLQAGSTHLLWSHATTPFWNVQTGLRQDHGEGPDRTWLALGLQGLAPYWLEADATFYVGEGGRTALALEVEYDLLLSQRLILQPRAELDIYGKDDLDQAIGSGLSEATVSLRLRYEISRKFAPYIGVESTGKFAGTADIARAAGKDARTTRLVAGVRFWF